MEEKNMLDSALELFQAKQYAKLKELFSSSEPADVAEVLSELERGQYVKLYRLLPKSIAADVFVEMDADAQKNLIDSFSDAEITEILEELFYDDTVDIIEEMPANVVDRIFKNALPETRKTLNDLMRYPESSAGSIMTTEYVYLKRTMTVGEALNRIRKVAIEKETIYTCYVTENRFLVGIITAKDLLISPLERKIEDIMETNVVSVKTEDDKEEAAAMFLKYDLLALPVVDKENRLVGIITVDDAMDVQNEEAEEDFAKMGAITPGDKPYLKTGVFEIWRKRIPWLLLLTLSATFTGMIISSFENALAAQIALTAFIPMLMGTGGNSGSQSSVTVIRGLSLGEIEFSDVLKILWKEFRVSILCGAVLSVVTYVKILLIDNLILGSGIDTLTALTVCITLFLTVVAAKILGCTLPIFAKKLGADPAVMASPLITTLVDAGSLVIYFAIAGLLLGI
ncbi:MAG: magnesium transporter [Ruminococcaceae bacterium]|nr:magnesium transporter [Oscillospiraceae bacterium]